MTDVKLNGADGCRRSTTDLSSEDDHELEESDDESESEEESTSSIARRCSIINLGVF